ncbi:MAG: fumarylacetoacetate hydrolase family protein [Gemmatimonadota bacterium]
MRLATLRRNGRFEAAVRSGDHYVPLPVLNHHTGASWPADVMELLVSGRFWVLKAWFEADGAAVLEKLRPEGESMEEVEFAPLYASPGKIWGIGLNYREHAGDLDELVPEGLPGSFMKPATAVIGPGDTVRISRLSQRTTAEAELGLVLGRRCKDVAAEGWQGVVAGYTTILDMTAEDILRRNPRFLTLSKSFDTFFAFGPELVTTDEVADVLALEVRTVHNGRVHAHNRVANMTYRPDFLVSLHSQVMTLRPGDVISTGTPGAAPIGHGDVVECDIDGFVPLVCSVVDDKVEE